MVTPHNQIKTRDQGQRDTENRTSERALSTSEALKCAALDIWVRDGHGYIDLIAANFLGVYTDDPGWLEVVETHKDRYQPLVKQAAVVASEVLSSIAQAGKESVLSPRQKAQVFDEVIRPVLIRLSDLLREFVAVVPDLDVELVRLGLKSQDKGHRFEEAKIEELAKNAALGKREEIESVLRQVRALALIQEPSAHTCDLASAGLVALVSTPYSRFRGTSWPPPSVFVAGPADLLHITLQALMADVSIIARDFREAMRQKILGVTVFDLTDEDSNEAQTAKLILSQDFVVMEVETEGTLRLSVPVVKEDYGSLSYLRDNFARLIKQYDSALEVLSASASTGVCPHPLMDGFSEFFLELKLSAIDQETDSQAIIPKFTSKQAKAEEFALRCKVSCLIRRLANGREYSLGASAEVLDGDRHLEEGYVQAQVDRLVEALSGVDTVYFFSGEVASSESEAEQDEQDDLEDDQDSGEADEDITDSLESPRIRKVRLMATAGGRGNATELARRSATFSQRQLEVVASQGLKVAGVLIDPKVDLPPVESLTVRESFLTDVELVDALQGLLARCRIGEFELNAENSIAREVLQAARQELDLYLADTGTTQRLMLQLTERHFGSIVQGTESFTGFALQILDEGGRVLAEGNYSPIGKKFQLHFVPAVILDDLSSAIADSLEEVAKKEGVIRLLPFGVAVENRGYRLATTVLFNVQQTFKALEGRERPEDLVSQVASYLRVVFLRSSVRHPKYNEASGIWEILEEEDLPPAQRRNLNE